MKTTKKRISKLDHAVERIAEIVIGQMSTLPIEKAKAMREEIRRLAARRPARKNRRKRRN
jgi:hypothetical protein